MNDFEAISIEQLGTVTGGGLKGKAAGWLGGKAQSAYKWWTGSKKAGSPKELYGEARDIGRDVGIAGAGGAAAWQMSKGGSTQSQPAPER